MKAISLFSGAGGDSLGLQKAGIEVNAYVEINKTYCETHDRNFPNSILIGNDITKIEDEEFKKYKGKINIIFAGFPCQSFSTAGKKNANDPRGQLYIQFVRAVRLIEPDYIIGENVKGLLRRKTSDGELFLDIITDNFKDLGYHVIHKVVKVRDYGVPQTRERLIILGCRKYVPSFPDTIKSELNLRNIIKFDMTGAIKIPKHIFDMTLLPPECILMDEENEEIEIGKDVHPYLRLKVESKDVTYNYKKKEKTYRVLLSFGKRDSPIHCEIIDIRNPCKTIICTFTHQPRLFVPLKNKNGYYLRCLLPNEYKEIQGFPPSFHLCGSIKDQIIQCGNAICPPVVETIVKHILH